MKIKKNRINITVYTVFAGGGDDRDRTDYLLNAIQALSQVSYTPKASHSEVLFPSALL